MIWPFKCKHPFNLLAVESTPTITKVDSDFISRQIRLRCTCGEVLTLKWADMIGGVDAFLKRK